MPKTDRGVFQIRRRIENGNLEDKDLMWSKKKKDLTRGMQSRSRERMYRSVAFFFLRVLLLIGKEWLADQMPEINERLAASEPATPGIVD